MYRPSTAARHELSPSRPRGRLQGAGNATQADATQADGSTERYHYPDPQEAPLTCDSPRRIEDAQGGSKQLAWSDAGQLLSYTDCSGHSTHYQYDRFGQLTEVTDALGQRQHQGQHQGKLAQLGAHGRACGASS